MEKKYSSISAYLWLNPALPYFLSPYDTCMVIKSVPYQKGHHVMHSAPLPIRPTCMEHDFQESVPVHHETSR